MVDILIDTQAELQELVVASGLKVLEAMLEDDRVAVCGPRYAHQPERQAYRAGHAPSQVVLGGRKVAIRRPRARRAGTEVPLPTVRAFTDADPLNRRVVDQMLIGVATRQYARSLDPLGADVTTRGTSKRAVSRRFVAQTQAQLAFDALDLAGLLIDGVTWGDTVVVALGIDKTGAKHPLGLRTRRSQGLLTNLASRGLRTDRLLVIVWGEGRTAVNVRPGRRGAAVYIKAGTSCARGATAVGDGKARLYTHERQDGRLLQDLARRLDTAYPSAAASVREGLDETLTVLGLGLSERLQSLARQTPSKSAQSHAPSETKCEALALGRWCFAGWPPVCSKPRKGSVG